ncbi:MAG: hypothetical protein A2X20_00165 [Bacteroidetes bacterium GWE2_40_15]|nr:MAG: hypothetical protein A2X20_00165 [Bacteroidetes bacterium GWE2_40_15]
MNWSTDKTKRNAMKNIFRSFILVFLLSVIVPFAAPSLNPVLAQEQNDPNCIREVNENSDIWQFRESYVPKKYFPTPEYMVFVDMGVLILILLTGLFLVIKRKPSRYINLLAIFTLVYLGLIRGGCICPVGVITNVTIGMITPKLVGLVTLIIFIAPLIIALFAGRVFCSSGCPLGAVQHIFYKKKKHIQLPPLVNNIVRVVPVLILIATVYFAIKSTYFLACQLEPYKALFFTGKVWFEQIVGLISGNPMEPKFLSAFGIFSWSYLAVILVIGYWIPRPFCRLLCPYGVLVGFVSIFSFKPRRIDAEKCTLCTACQKICPTQSIVIDRKNKVTKLSNYNCVQCNLCSDTCKFKAI